MEHTVLKLFLLVFPLLPVSAAGKKHHKAHSHGLAKVEIHFEEKSGIIELEAPADSIYGFETEPKTPAQRKILDDKQNLLKNRVTDLFVLDSKKGCSFAIKEFKPFEREGKHAEVEISYSVICKEPLQGSKLQLGLFKHFPNLKKVKVEALIGSKATVVDVTESNSSIEL